MDLNRMTKAELITYAKELEKVARDNKEAARRAMVVAESFQAIFEKEGSIKSDAPSLLEH